VAVTPGAGVNSVLLIPSPPGVSTTRWKAPAPPPRLPKGASIRCTAAVLLNL
jgi:hypothetical protein